MERQCDYRDNILPNSNDSLLLYAQLEYQSKAIWQQTIEIGAIERKNHYVYVRNFRANYTSFLVYEFLWYYMSRFFVLDCHLITVFIER